MAQPKVLSLILAGGEGKRLLPLTADRAKPAVPFGGTYRLIDFALSNMVNSDLTKVAVLTQYKSHSLDRHISITWRMSTLLGNYVTPVPAQQRRGPHWYQGSADAIYQSMNLINDENPDYIVVFGADNIYRMDVEQMLDQAVERFVGDLGPAPHLGGDPCGDLCVSGIPSLHGPLGRRGGQVFRDPLRGEPEPLPQAAELRSRHGQSPRLGGGLLVGGHSLIAFMLSAIASRIHCSSSALISSVWLWVPRSRRAAIS